MSKKKEDKKSKKNAKKIHFLLEESDLSTLGEELLPKTKKSKKSTKEAEVPMDRVEYDPLLEACIEEQQEPQKNVEIVVKKSDLNYEKELRKLQVELLKFQTHVKEKGLKVLIIFEGRDTAGKGGTIKRMTEHLNPRGARVVALPKPSDIERTQWYFQRYARHLPSAGEIVFFDRSWYNRAGVEPVMGFCTKGEHNSFLKQVPLFEMMLISSDIMLFKFYFSISKEEQAKRLHARKTDPLKMFKVSAVDEKAQELWDQYTVAKYSMLLSSHTNYCPWTIIDADNKKKARLNAIKHILKNVDYPDKTDKEKLETNPKIVTTGEEQIALMENLALNTLSNSEANIE